MDRTLQPSQTEKGTKTEGGKERGAKKRPMWSDKDGQNNVILTEEKHPSLLNVKTLFSTVRKTRITKTPSYLY